MPWGISEQVAHLQNLLAPGVLGTYRSFEVTELVGFEPNQAPKNFFSLLVAEPASAPHPSPGSVSFISGAKPLRLNGTDWRFGVARHRISLQQGIDALVRYGDTTVWSPAGNALGVGKLRPATPQFVPADGSGAHPWNGLLKNNFFEGSHVVELCDEEKLHVLFLLQQPELLANLAALVQQYVPGIDGLSDRLGNVLFQVPVTIVSLGIRGSAHGHITLSPAWHPSATPRPLRVSFERYRDGTVDDFAAGPMQCAVTNFPLHVPSGGPRYVVWDDAHQVVVGASAPTAFITSISVGVHIDGQPVGPARVFTVPAAPGAPVHQRVQLVENVTRTLHGPQPHGDPREPWRSRRVFRESLSRLQQRKEFVQYGGPSGPNRQQALADLRWLINEHGRGGAWLWDPFLSAEDVLETLFHCRHRGVDLRALSAGKEPREVDSPAPNKAVHYLRGASRWAEKQLTTGRLGKWLEQAHPIPAWKDRHFRTLEEHKGNCEGLKLQFRVRVGRGWPFHDRFIILPGLNPGEAKAWSLGTSVNSLGNEHHILQMVTDGERIRLAFLELWNELTAPEVKVWSST